MKHNLVFAAALTLASVSTHAQLLQPQSCSGGVCGTYAFSVPVAITSTATTPAFTVTGGAVGIGTTAAQNALDVQNSAQNAAMMGVKAVLTPVDSTSGSFQHAAGSFAVYPSIASGVTEASTQSGLYVSALRNFSLSSADSGAATAIRGINLYYGHDNTNTGTPQTTSAYGIAVTPYLKTGTLTNAYDLWLGTATTGATITGAHYGLYQTDSAISNFMAGSTGLGTNSPVDLLHVSKTGNAFYMPVRLQNADNTNSGSATSIGFKVGSGFTDQAYKGAIAFERTASGGRGQFDFMVNAVADTTDTVAADTKMVINYLGRVGIGNTAPGYVLDVSGDVNSSTALRIAGTQVCSNTGCTSASDSRLKENVQTLNEDSLAKLNLLKAIRYDWKDKSKYGNDRQIGFIAQDLERVYPEFVRTDSKTGMKSVAYDHVVVPVVAAVNDLSAEVERLKKENKKLQDRLAHIEALMEKAN